MRAAIQRVWILYPILIFATLVCWAWSSPPGSSPDEDFHLVNAWCALGPRDGICQPGATSMTKAVPRDVAEVACFAFKPEQSGSCPSHGQEIVETSRWNYGHYPEGFYAVMGVLVGPSVEFSVLAMRVLNSAIYAVGFFALLLVSEPRRRANYILASAVTLVPLGLFTITSANPSSWAIISASFVWPAVVEFVWSTRRWKRVALAALCLLGFALAFASRADAAAFAALALGLGWLAIAKIGRRTLLYGAVVAGVGLVAVLWSRSIRQLGDLVRPTPGTEEPGGWFRLIKDIPNLYAGSFGTRGLGWLDTTMPWITWIFAGSVFAMLILWGLRRCSWRKAVSLVIILTIGSVVPMSIAAARHVVLLGAVQPRYFLPLIVLAAMIAVSQDNFQGPQLNAAQCALIVVALGLAHAAALHANLRRYVTGSEAQWFNLDAGVEWWWKTGALPPMVVFGLGSVFFVLALVAAMVAQRSPLEPTPSMPTAGGETGQDSSAIPSVGQAPRPGARFVDEPRM